MTVADYIARHPLPLPVPSGDRWVPEQCYRCRADARADGLCDRCYRQENS